MSHLFSRVLEMQNLQVRSTPKSVHGGKVTISKVDEKIWNRVLGFRVGDIVKTPCGIGLVELKDPMEGYLIHFLFPPYCSKVFFICCLSVPSKWEKRIAIQKGLWIEAKHCFHSLRSTERKWILKRT